MVPADSGRISRVPPYSGAGCRRTLPSLTGLSPSAARLSRHFCWLCFAGPPPVLQPRPRRDGAGLGCCAFARHYLRNHCCFLFLRLLRCFSSPGWHRALRGDRLCGRVAPFGNPCLSGYLPLGTAYRSLSRPSSPPRAKASFMCPFLLSVFRCR